MPKYPCDYENGTCPYDAEQGNVCSHYCYDNDDYTDNKPTEHPEVSKPKLKILVNIEELLVEGVYVNSDEYDIEVLVVESDKESDLTKDEITEAQDKIQSFIIEEKLKEVFVDKTLIDYELKLEV